MQFVLHIKTVCVAITELTLMLILCKVLEISIDKLNMSYLLSALTISQLSFYLLNKLKFSNSATEEFFLEKVEHESKVTHSFHRSMSDLRSHGLSAVRKFIATHPASKVTYFTNNYENDYHLISHFEEGLIDKIITTETEMNNHLEQTISSEHRSVEPNLLVVENRDDLVEPVVQLSRKLNLSIVILKASSRV